MTYKLLDPAEDRWRRVNIAELVVQVSVGIGFKDGIRIERRTQESGDAAQPLNPIITIWRYLPRDSCAIGPPCRDGPDKNSG